MKVVILSALRAGRLYHQEIFLVIFPVRVCVNSRSILRLEGLCQLKFLMTPSGIEPTNFRLVVQLRNREPKVTIVKFNFNHFHDPIFLFILI